jgi:excisionase family DNA binding protein
MTTLADLFTPGPTRSYDVRDIPLPSRSLLSVDEAAEYLSMSAKWVYRNYRDLPHVLIGSGERPRIRFRASDLDQWINARTIDWRRA